ncbi:MAG: hypothetical protein M3299_12595, partial [Thermoproteota archaeon]|nr:hypothetical protein [Thermoproteota archaeon]
MSAQKTTTKKTRRTSATAIATPLGIIIVVLPIYCSIVFSEVVTTSNLATGVLAPSSTSNASVDNSIGVIRIRTITYSTASSALRLKGEDDDIQNLHSIIPSGTVLYLIKDYEEEDNNIGLAGAGISILHSSSSGGSSSRPGRRSSSFGNNNNYYYNNGFDLDSKKANNIISGRNSSGNNNKLIHSSFRIQQGVIKSLERVAASRDMSLSSLVNKILKNYVTSEMYFEELGFILVSKNFLRKTFEGLNQKHIEELGKEYGMTIAKEYIS